MVWGILLHVGPESTSELQLPPWHFEDDIREIKVGRTPDNTFVVSKPYVSACHFSIAVNDNGSDKYVLKDFSSNGTFVNEIRVGKGNSIDLRVGDKVSLQFKSKTQLMFEFRIPETLPDDGVEEPPSKSQRAGGRKRAGLHRTEGTESSTTIDTASAMRIAALERDNELQEQRIGSYITKLESSAREVGNLQRELQLLRERVQEKDSELTEEKQNRLVTSSANAALEARCRSLDDTISALKLQVESQRDQLRAKEEQASVVNELQVKIDTLKDELEHKKSQYDSSCRVVQDLSGSVSRYRRELEETESALEGCRESLRQRDEGHREAVRKIEKLKQLSGDKVQQIQKYQVVHRQLKVLLQSLNAEILSRRTTTKANLEETMAHIDALRGVVATASSSSAAHADDLQQTITSMLNAIPVQEPASEIPSPSGDTPTALGKCTQVGANVRTPPVHVDLTQLHDVTSNTPVEDGDNPRGGETGTALNLMFSAASDDEEDERESPAPHTGGGCSGHMEGSSSPSHKPKSGASTGSALISTAVSIGGVYGGTQISTLPHSPSLGRGGALGREVSAASSAPRPPSSLANRQHSAYDTISSSLIDEALVERRVTDDNEATAAPEAHLSEAENGAGEARDGGSDSIADEGRAGGGVSQTSFGGNEYDVADEDDSLGGTTANQRQHSGKSGNGTRRKRTRTDWRESQDEEVSMSDSPPVDGEDSSGISGMA